MYDKNQIKESLTINQVFNYVAFLGGDPQMHDDYFISQTICHNPPGEGSYKLYYYNNSKLFTCYTECGENFDIYTLTYKVKKIRKENLSFLQCVDFVAQFFGYDNKQFEFKDLNPPLEDWNLFEHYKKISEKKVRQADLKFFEKDVLSYFPQPRILTWEQENISYAILKKRNIRYNPIDCSILIPHYDINNNLIGIRRRTLVKEEEEEGKYKPAFIKGVLYNHPLSFSLYNLNNSKENIKKIKKAIIFEGEKGCLQYASMFGEDKDISVACCGSSLTFYQIQLLIFLGVEEIIIGFDKQFKEIGDPEFQQWKTKLIKLNEKYKLYATISFLFDKKNILSYKSSPVDEGKEKFLKLFEERIIL